MTSSVTLEVVLILGLVLANGLFAMSEMALVASRKARKALGSLAAVRSRIVRILAGRFNPNLARPIACSFPAFFKPEAVARITMLASSPPERRRNCSMIVPEES